MGFLLLLVGIMLVALIPNKNAQLSDPNVLSKSETIAIRGVGMLIIVFSHLVSSGVGITYFFYVSGVLGVCLCFLVSGYGLAKAYSKSSSYLKGFLKTKLLRCLLPYLLVYTLYLIYAFVMGVFPSLSEIFHQLIRLRFPGDAILWYLKVQLLLYLFFWLSYRFISKKYKLPALFGFCFLFYLIGIATGIETYWYKTSMFFPLGVLLAKKDAVVLPIVRKRISVFLSFGVTLVIFGIIYLWGRLGMELLIESIYMLAFSILILGSSRLVSRSWFFALLGKYSLEIYLVHCLLLNLNPGSFFDPMLPLSYLYCWIATLAISLPLHWLSAKLSNLLISKR